MPWGRGHLFVDVLWRWIVMWSAGLAALITVTYWFDGDGAGSGDLDPLDAVVLGVRHGVMTGVIWGGPSGMLAGVLAAALLVPYRRKPTTVRTMGVLSAVSATVPVAGLIVVIWLGPEDLLTYPFILLAGVAVYAVVMSGWLAAGFVSSAEAESPAGVAAGATQVRPTGRPRRHRST